MKITICGSSEFVSEMEKSSEYLKEKGFEVFLPEPLVSEADYEKENGREKLLKMKPFFTKRHSKKIETSDAVLIINNKKKNVEGYIGTNTLIELGIAFYLDKKIFLLNNINEDHPHYEELIGMNTLILNGDLSKLK